MNILLQAAPFMPPQASTVAGVTDSLYGFIFWLSVVFFILVIGPGAYFVWKYRQRDGKETITPRITHHTGLELAWSIVPLILVIVIAIWGFKDFIVLGVSPYGAEEIQVTGKKWAWAFEHKDGTKELNELHVKVNQPYKLILNSEDVIHSFFVPSFRVKQDLPPGRYTYLWFTPTQVGPQQVFCTEYCGDGHSGMLATIQVMTEKDYDEFMKNGDPNMQPTADAGALLYKSKSCNTCHSVDGSKVVGPSFKGIFGHPQPLEGGANVSVDENYIRESILQPNAKIAQGYPNLMPSYQGLLKEKELQAIIAYIKSLQ